MGSDDLQGFRPSILLGRNCHARLRCIGGRLPHLDVSDAVNVIASCAIFLLMAVKSSKQLSETKN
jgi:hypothetical protein